jgi:hypothetical protein
MARSHPVRWTVLFFLILTCSTPIHAQKRISAQDAKNYVGENATVCGTVASEHFAANTKGQPTFINLDEPCPRQIFTIVIWGSDRSAFGKIPAKLCVTGTISSYRGVPEVIARNAGQIRPRSD